MREGTIAEQRNADVVSAFFDGIKRLGQHSVTENEIIRNIMKNGAPRFYVTYEKASRFVSMIERGKELPLSNPNKIAMYMELHRRYRAYADTHECYGYKVLEDIIKEPAPSFYMELKTFLDIVYKHYKNRKIKAVCSL